MIRLKRFAALLTAAMITVIMQLQTYAYECEVSSEEMRMLEAVVMHEVGYCSRESIVAVTHVVRNRIKSPLFPDTVKEVLHQKGQFSAIQNYYDHEIPVSYKVHKIVREALEMPDVTDGALFFYAPRYMQKGSSAFQWFQSLETTLICEGVWYCK